MQRIFILFAILVSICGSWAHARTLLTGPGREFPTLQQAAAAVQPGDIVSIAPGIYREAVIWRGGSLTGQPITIRGEGSPAPVIDGTGLSLTGVGQVPRGLFQIQGENFIVENLEFRNARNGDNAAGIRVVYAKKTVIRSVKVVWNDMGILSSQNDDLLVERSEIAWNGTPEYNGYSHNFYLEGDRATVRYCYIHDATNGQTFKARSRYVELLYNYIADAHDRIDFGDTTKEIGLQNGAQTAEPNAHAVLIGNIIVKRGDGYSFVDFGPEGTTPKRNGKLFMIHNTVIRDGKPSKWLLRLGHTTQAAVLYNNVFYTSAAAEFSRGDGGKNVTGANNWFYAGSIVPASLTGSIFGTDPGFVNRGARDYRLRASSPLLNSGYANPVYLDGQGAQRSGIPTGMYLPHLDYRATTLSGAPDLGALQLAAEDCAATALTISGRLTDQTGQGLGFHPVVLEGPDSRSVMTAGDGSYLFSSLRNNTSYIVRPWAGALGFANPTSAIHIAGAPRTANFQSLPAYTICGRVLSSSLAPVNAAIVYLHGPRSAWTITGVDGLFSFTLRPAGGPYSLNALASAETIQGKPVIAVLGANTTANIYASPLHTINIRALDASGKGIRGLTLDMTGSSTRSTVTNSHGTAYFGNLPAGGDYEIKLRNSGLLFSPMSGLYPGLNANQRLDFVGPPSIAVRGMVRQANGQPVAEATIRFSGLQILSGATSLADGSFEVPGVVEGGNFSLSATATGFVFSAPFTITGLRAGQTFSFTATPAYTLRGRVVNETGSPLVNVRMTLSGSVSRTAHTNSLGEYTITGIAQGSTVRLTPDLSINVFTPALADIANIAADQTRDFVGRKP